MEQSYNLPNNPKTGARRELQLVQDTDAQNPRTDWDQFGHMICFHSRYSLGDEHNHSEPSEVEDIIKEENAVHLPLFLYDHSGITMAVTPFSCPWDSGQVGYIYVTADEIKEAYGNDEQSARITALKVLQAEVETYDQFLRGDVYGFQVVEFDEDDEEDMQDSCWGFFGDDLDENGILDHLEEEDRIFVRKQL